MFFISQTQAPKGTNQMSFQNKPHVCLAVAHINSMAATWRSHGASHSPNGSACKLGCGVLGLLSSLQGHLLPPHSSSCVCICGTKRLAFHPRHTLPYTVWPRGFDMLFICSQCMPKNCTEKEISWHVVPKNFFKFGSNISQYS